jgi:N-formylglutamate amidohydrolase
MFSYYQRGDLPILLSAPHGGDKRIPGIPNRTGRVRGRAVPQFYAVQDDGTLELTLKLSDDIFNKLGKRPYLVAADFKRKQIDANRPADRAYEVAEAKPYYDFYHNKLKEYIREIKNRFGDNAILLDIHGQGISSDEIYRGTTVSRPGDTFKRFINREGLDSLTGRNSILGYLDNELGHKIRPRNSTGIRVAENPNFSGGYIVRAYGSNNANGIDALQLENGWTLRRNGRDQFAQDLADATVHFYREYLE